MAMPASIAMSAIGMGQMIGPAGEFVGMEKLFEDPPVPGMPGMPGIEVVGELPDPVPGREPSIPCMPGIEVVGELPDPVPGREPSIPCMPGIVELLPVELVEPDGVEVPSIPGIPGIEVEARPPEESEVPTGESMFMAPLALPVVEFIGTMPVALGTSEPMVLSTAAEPKTATSTSGVMATATEDGPA
ncbi:MAG: hypothetical protein ABIY38_02890 [Rhodococcus sp. (in: high G+C Gram-positive bacteria)]